MDTHLTENFSPAAFSRTDRSYFAGDSEAGSHSEPLADRQGWGSADVEQSDAQHDYYDDGLVHSHGWATSDR